jgi:hypothetical protein
MRGRGWPGSGGEDQLEDKSRNSLSSKTYQHDEILDTEITSQFLLGVYLLFCASPVL